ncbi:hypothetical protein PCC7805_02257 [Planktothrix agardhii]|jgi:hypothetical protein|uniref:Uncharacterized protein n=1 Tax=Planktothrix agardhii TaxID=1160 RepID=A0A1J1JG20_PLAAG|nr:hypothetical protein [Planktothrix agardhii]MCP9294960.1 hypothetical protein [Planktothrix agardhii LY1]CAD5946088.1 hypothetical protein PCC7805_02257 [Planktothrix agardhii]CUM60061.1 conserved protein of unknown function [Planktothrix agardhii]
MSLDITFYSKNGEAPATIEFSEQFYERLIKSDFVEIGKRHKLELIIDDEKTEIDAIDLDKGKITNRQRLIDFLKEVIVEESLNMIERLGDSPSKEEYKSQTSALRIFQKILQCLKNPQYTYIEY